MSLKDKEKDFDKYLQKELLSLHGSCIWGRSYH